MPNKLKVFLAYWVACAALMATLAALDTRAPAFGALLFVCFGVLPVAGVVLVSATKD